MKLLHIKTCQVVEVPDSQLPTYAVLSHTWSNQDILASNCRADDLRRLEVHERTIRACQSAAHRGITHLWVDCLCIDSSSSADLDEAVNGSLRRLKKSSVCLAYLDDLPADGPPLDESIWRRCRYWKRAWTLQELIVPTKVEFFDKQWNYRGSKASSDLLPLLSSITGVPRSVLLDGNTLSGISLAVRISWSAGRSTRREEDAVYSLAAITGASMLVRYGEVERAFLQLQEEILNDTKDGSIFAWRSVNNQDIRELLARSPSEFHHFATEPESAYQKPWIFDGKVR